MTPHAQDSRKQNIKTMARTQALDSSGMNKICVQGANKKSSGARSPESLAQVSSMFAASDSEV